ncbi:MAG: carbohydrate kinase [Bacteroidales bacterium]|nr:carbohydrate kinase [Bacteroidales bacterium]
MTKKKYLLGFDIGSSSVKAALIDADTGLKAGSAQSPETEMPISAIHPGWAEQSPDSWWDHAKMALGKIFKDRSLSIADVIAIGISYQMHGLVAVDKDLKPLRPSIIWCDSRAATIGDEAFEKIGEQKSLNSLLNNPGNFTAAKLAWVKRNEPNIYREIYKIMLPGDFIAARLTGEISTTVSGLSEGILWDFKKHQLSEDIIDALALNKEHIPFIVPSFGDQGHVSLAASQETGLPLGIPISYRAGDQPNNAASLNVFEPGELAATAGTSGVIYGILDKLNHDPQSRVNIFAHVNHNPDLPRLGVLLCINGTGILYSWIKNQFFSNKSYNDLNEESRKAPAGSDGLMVYPFGNGLERVLQNQPFGGQFLNLDFNRHNRAHVIRAAKEGIVYALNYGFEAMQQMGVKTKVVRAGEANMFQSSLFTSIFATVTNTIVELYDTDGALGAARAAGVGAGYYASVKQAFESLKLIKQVEPDIKLKSFYDEQYQSWKQNLTLKNT